MASREFTPLEYHTNVSSLSFDSEGGYDEQGTTNCEIVAKHLGIGTFIYVLSSRGSMSKITIESTNSKDSIVDIEEKLEKAVEMLKLQRERKEFSDVFLKAEKDKADKIVSAVFSSMVDEIEKILK